MTPTVLGILAVIGGLLAVVIVVGVILHRRQQALPGAPPPKAIEPGKVSAEREPAVKPVGRPTAEDLERDRLRRGLAQTRGGFVARLSRLFSGRPEVSEDLKDEIETVLFTADIGARTAQKLLEQVSDVLDRNTVADPDAVWKVIREEALAILDIPAPPLNYAPEHGPYVLLMIGVNGVGKTTTLGKLAQRHRDAGRKVLLVAGDTFRAAAVEQLEVWADRVGASVHKGSQGADPSSVIHDGIARGRDEGFDVVLCDTAGRLHTKKELMAELSKVRRSCAKAMRRGLEGDEAKAIKGPHDTFLVLDATIGQNALSQAELFNETMDFTGLVLTKLDGTAKGGVILGVCDAMRVPVRFVGIGERVEDLREFDPAMFVDALFAPDIDP
ncbi:MAG: signal recognition particle-docking protein FtsY [Myxococcales bacterium]|nr:signal recognition particle-docking protein FtsY [Myxococcales bacterium]